MWRTAWHESGETVEISPGGHKRLVGGSAHLCGRSWLPAIRSRESGEQARSPVVNPASVRASTAGLPLRHYNVAPGGRAFALRWYFSAVAAFAAYNMSESAR